MRQHEKVHLPATALLVLGAAALAVIHSVLPDHWVPLAVVARTQGWSMVRLARVSSLAAGGHVLASVVLGGAVALVGLRFQHQVETQQGHIVGALLIVTGLGFFAWGLAGHGHAHDHDDKAPAAEPQSHQHEHTTNAAAMDSRGQHSHEHAHGGLQHRHAHSHEAYVRAQADRIAHHSERGGVAGQFAAIAVPFGIAASPDLTFLPIGITAGAYGTGEVVTVLAVFAAGTMATFVGLTLAATAAGYQMRGEWLEDHANTITSLVLVGIGLVAFAGF